MEQVLRIFAVIVVTAACACKIEALQPTGEGINACSRSAFLFICYLRRTDSSSPIPEQFYRLSASSSNNDIAGICFHSSIEGNFDAVWVPTRSDTQQWMRIQFKVLVQIDEIALQEKPSFSQWVTSYKMNYSYTHTTEDRIPVLDTSITSGEVKIFEGNTNEGTYYSHTFAPHLVATAVTLIPVAWRNGIAMRVSITGCDAQIQESMCSMHTTLLCDGKRVINEIIASGDSDTKNLCADSDDVWTHTGTGKAFVEVHTDREYTIFAVAAIPTNRLGSDGVTNYSVDYSHEFLNPTYIPVSNNIGERRFFTSAYPINNYMPIGTNARRVKFTIEAYIGPRVATRLEIYGCEQLPQQQCNQMQSLVCDGATVKNTLTYNDTGYSKPCLADSGAWEAIGEQKWLTVILVKVYLLHAVTTLGHAAKPQWVTIYRVQYSCCDGDNRAFTDVKYVDGHTWRFNGNTDTTTQTTNYLPKNINATAVRIIPLKWHGDSSMRLEVYGCKDSKVHPMTRALATSRAANGGDTSTEDTGNNSTRASPRNAASSKENNNDVVFSILGAGVIIVLSCVFGALCYGKITGSRQASYSQSRGGSQSISQGSRGSRASSGSPQSGRDSLASRQSGRDSVESRQSGRDSVESRQSSSMA